MLARLGTVNHRSSKSTPRTLGGNNPDIKYVQVVIEFTRIGEIDTMNEKYQAEVIIESKWTENFDIIEYDPDLHWNPKLFIENAINELKETISYRTHKENGCTVITEVRRSKGKFFL